MATAVNALLGSSGNTSSTSNPTSSNTSSIGGSPAPSEQMFLQLLVAQMKYQDPLNPTDSTQFVTQLAQFSELEQVIGIRSDIESYHAAATGANSGTTASTGSADNTPTGASVGATPATTETPAAPASSNTTAASQS